MRRVRFKGGAGFTLVEIVIVVALIAGLSLLGVPFGIDNYRDYVLTSTMRDVVSVLRRAETFALANTSSSHYGVALRVNTIILFKGASYASREPSFDETHILPPTVIVTGPSEVVFAPLSGMPLATSSVIVGNGIRSQTIDINLHGVITW